ncbi:MAG: alanyl-tRNA editing protein [Deltaproteobacteria bacterium]|nr:alanyl-tRNA editing protein [Deltaproteobacteria bacterium]
MPDSQRLYHDDSRLCSFDATVARHGEHHGRASVVLEATAFYPEAGGQMADHGQLGGVEVVDVQVEDSGSIHHHLDGPLPAVGATVRGEVDWERRRCHRALHTGQHILSRALLDVARAHTVSSRLGETACTIDIDQRQLEEAVLAEVVQVANDVIDADLPVRAYFPTADELRGLELRRPSKVTDHVRVVQIGELDVTPCGGTHCERTAQVGLVVVSGVERHKRRVRITFAAGGRARRQCREETKVLHQLATRFSCAALGVPAAVDSLSRELRAARDEGKRAQAELAARIAAELLGQGTVDGRVVALIDGGTVDLLRAVAARLTAEPGAVALLAAAEAEGMRVVVARSADSDFECGAFVKRLAASTGGRGGGRSDHAEGRLPAETDWEKLARG